MTLNWTFASVFKPVAYGLWLSLDLFLDLITQVVVFICMKSEVITFVISSRFRDFALSSCGL